MAVVLFHNSRFNFHCYAQKSARKWQLQPFATSSTNDYEGHSLVQTSLAEVPNSSHNEVEGNSKAREPTSERSAVNAEFVVRLTKGGP